MTTKEELREIVNTISEQEAAELLDYAHWLLQEEETLSEEELASAEDALQQVRRGEYVTLAEVKPRLGL